MMLKPPRLDTKNALFSIRGDEGAIRNVNYVIISNSIFPRISASPIPGIEEVNDEELCLSPIGELFYLHYIDATACALPLLVPQVPHR